MSIEKALSPAMEPTPEQQEKWNLEQIKQGHSRLFARPIGTHMRQLLSKQGYGNVEAAQALRELWDSIVGQPLAKASRLGRISRGALLVEVNCSQACQELYFQKPRILKAIQAQLPEQRISRLTFKVVSF